MGGGLFYLFYCVVDAKSKFEGCKINLLKLTGKKWVGGTQLWKQREEDDKKATRKCPSCLEINECHYWFFNTVTNKCLLNGRPWCNWGWWENSGQLLMLEQLGVKLYLNWFYNVFRGTNHPCRELICNIPPVEVRAGKAVPARASTGRPMYFSFLPPLCGQEYFLWLYFKHMSWYSLN